MIPSTKRLSALHRPRSNNVSCLILLSVTIFSIAGCCRWVGVESFLLPTTARCHHYDQRLQGLTAPITASSHRNGHRNGHGHGHVAKRCSGLVLRSSDDDANSNTNTNSNSNISARTGGSGVLESVGLVSQPIVWISLYFLATTGHGLPAGPGGSIGAVEGIAYLVVVILSVTASDNGIDLNVDISNDNSNDKDISRTSPPVNARTVSRITIALGLLVLAGVAAGKGCVPNAKPILDYSNYLPVCSAE